VKVSRDGGLSLCSGQGMAEVPAFQSKKDPEKDHGGDLYYRFL
jgi:hypothetical protein